MNSTAPLKIQVRNGPRYCGLDGEHAKIPIVKLRATMNATFIALKPWRKKSITIENTAKKGIRGRLLEEGIDDELDGLRVAPS